MTERPRILIVEDDHILRRSLVELLSQKYDVFELANGEEVISVIKKFRIDLILLDYVLSGVQDGLTVVNNVRRNPKWNEIIIIIISGFNNEELIESALVSGANDFIVKPLLPKLVFQKISNFFVFKENIRLAKYISESSADYEQFSSEDHFDKLNKFETIIEDMIEKDFSISIVDIAKNLSISVSSFARITKKIYNTTPNKYIRKRKLEKAKFLLFYKKMMIKEVSLVLGFNSVSYFCKCFKDEFGVNPSSLRLLNVFSEYTEA